MQRFSARLSTRAKICLSFAALVFVAFGALGTLAGRWVDGHVRDLGARRVEDNAARLALLLDASLFERQRDVANLAASIDTAPTVGARRADIERLKATFPHYAWIALTDPHGRVTSATSGVLQGSDVSGRPWWAAGVRRPAVLNVHDAVLLKPYLGPGPDDGPPRLLDVAAPIVAGGRTVGVLGAHLSWRWAGEIEQQASEMMSDARDVEHFVFDAQGTNLRLKPGQAGGAHPDGLAGMANKPAAVVPWSDGGRYLTAVVRRNGYRDFAGLGWMVVVRQPEALVTGPVRQLVNVAWAASALAGASLLLLAWWATGRLLRPLREAAGAAKAVLPATGDKAADEAVQLSAAMANLIHQLRGREQELTALAASLEQRVAERTAQLEQRNAELRGMARMVGHDVRAPVLSIGRLLEVARSAGPQRRAEIIDLAMRECSHVGEVIDALQQLSTSESRPLDRVPVDMDRLVRDAVRRQGTAAAYPGEVSVEGLPACCGDPVLLGEVWANLIGNAMKFSRHAAAPKIVVRGEAREGGLVYSVTDNGLGFEPRRSGELFNAFTRLVQDGRFPGTGLGLAIVRRIVERHGGEVRATGQPGQGATFSFRLPPGASGRPAPGLGTALVSRAGGFEFSQAARPIERGSPGGGPPA